MRALVLLSFSVNKITKNVDEMFGRGRPRDKEQSVRFGYDLLLSCIQEYYFFGYRYGTWELSQSLMYYSLIYVSAKFHKFLPIYSNVYDND